MSSRVLVILALLPSTDCAYNYAGQEGKVHNDPREPQDSRVVELKAEPVAEIAPDPEPPKTNSLCIIQTLDLHFYDAAAQLTRTLDCTTKKVTQVHRTPLPQATYEAKRQAGLPEGRWYFLVDPTGTQTTYPNNDVLLKVSQNFKIEFFGRESGKGLLVYLFLEELS